MADSTKILEGVFAIHKPPSLSSAQVLRDLQNTFAKSNTFAPLLEDTKRKQAEQERHQRKRRRRDNDQFFKMGHGGTLDPMATGVLIVGIGRGTKYLQNFLGCTKQYDTVVLFGKTTDTYDICGKIVGEASFNQITKEKIEAKLDLFRGKIKQVPPVYSALKINGIKAYDYARSGKELPRELESRDMQVDQCTMTDYYEGGNHNFRWPAEEASDDEKQAAQKLIRRGGASSDAKGRIMDQKSEPEESSTEDRQPPATVVDSSVESAVTATENVKEQSPTPQNEKRRSLSPINKAALHTHNPTLGSSPSPAPAARVTLQVSSGFYVRSFAHDLGIALNSYGIMAELIRSRQSDYTVSSPPQDGLTTTLTYSDLEAGEEKWGPIITDMLEKWMIANPVQSQEGRIDDRDRPEPSPNYRGNRGGRGNRNQWEKKGSWNNNRGGNKRTQDDENGRRRNSSSPE